MPKARSPNRDKSFEIWRDSGGSIPLKNIADLLCVSASQIRNWKVKDNWDKLLNDCATNQNATNDCVANDCATISHKKRGAPPGNHNAAGHGAPPDNKNGVGNKGGPPPGNKNAVTTGEYESIWFDCLTDEEKVLCGTINTDTLSQVEEDIRLITLRERRMMERIRRLMEGLTEKERNVLHELQIQKHLIEVYDEKTGQSKIVAVPESKMIVTEIRETEFRVLDDIVKLEDALTRVQEKKTRQLALKHTIELATKAETEQLLRIEKLKVEIEKFRGSGDTNDLLDAVLTEEGLDDG